MRPSVQLRRPSRGPVTQPALRHRGAESAHADRCQKGAPDQFRGQRRCGVPKGWQKFYFHQPMWQVPSGPRLQPQRLFGPALLLPAQGLLTQHLSETQRLPLRGLILVPMILVPMILVPMILALVILALVILALVILVPVRLVPVGARPPTQHLQPPRHPRPAAR